MAMAPTKKRTVSSSAADKIRAAAAQRAKKVASKK